MECNNHSEGTAGGICEKCKKAFSTLELELHDREIHGAQGFTTMFEVVSAMETTLHITDDELTDGLFPTKSHDLFTDFHSATPSDKKLCDGPANSDLEDAKTTEAHGKWQILADLSLV